MYVYTLTVASSSYLICVYGIFFFLTNDALFQNANFAPFLRVFDLGLRYKETILIRKFTYSCLVDLNIFRIEIYNEQQTRICVIVISKNILVNMWWLFQSIPSRGFWLLLYLSYL